MMNSRERPSNKKIVTFEASAELKEKLRAEAFGKKVSVSELIRNILSAELNLVGQERKTKANKSSEGENEKPNEQTALASDS